MRIFDFDRAIVRKPGKSVVNGLRSDPHAVPDYPKLVAEHTAYVGALRDAGLAVDVLLALEAYPDSIFVEDPALVLPEGAILLHPGASTRRGESAELRSTLMRHFECVLDIDGDAFVDGGDVLVAPDAVLIGLSGRTNRAGADALSERLKQFGRTAQVVEAPPGVLHFKTGVSLLSEDTVLATKQVAASGIFSKLNVIVTPEDEEAAANALRVNDTVLIGTGYPRTRDNLVRQGFSIRELSVTEIGKLDAGLSCMSLRWGKSGDQCRRSFPRMTPG